MPKSNLCKHREDPRRAEIKAVLVSGMIRKGMTQRSLAKRIKMPYSTMTQRLREPETIRLDELWRMLDALDVPAEERTKTIS